MQVLWHQYNPWALTDTFTLRAYRTGPRAFSPDSTAAPSNLMASLYTTYKSKSAYLWNINQFQCEHADSRTGVQLLCTSQSSSSSFLVLLFSGCRVNLPVEASLIQPCTQPLLFRTCRSTFVADHLRLRPPQCRLSTVARGIHISQRQSGRAVGTLMTSMKQSLRLSWQVQYS